MNLANVRRELRYSPLAGGVFNIRIRALSFGVLDISASAVHLDCDPAKLPRADSVQLSWVANTTLDMEGRAISGEQGLRLTLLDHHIEQRAVLYFDPSNRELLLRALHQLREMRLLQENDDSAMQTRVPKHSDIEKALNELQLDERAKGDWKVNIEKWIESNSLPIARMGPHAWPLTLRTLGETLSTFHVRENRFERYLGDLLDVVVKENRPRRIHAVPMRPLRDLSMLLNRYKSKFDSKDIKWHPSLWEFLGLSWEECQDANQCLVALDVYVSRGHSRRKFVKLINVSSPETLAKYFKRFYLAAVTGHHDPMPFDQEAKTLRDLGVEILPLIGHSFQADARSMDWRNFLSTLGRNVPERAPSKVIFDFGATTDAIPLYWQPTDDWNPLFQSFMLHAPNHKPIPRARFFSAYPKTLEHLSKRTAHGGTVVLRAPQGSGKTYLAAKLAELSLSSCYVFWYRCRLGALEDLVENLDIFLDSLSIDFKLSSSLYKPQYEAELADALINTLRRLDRPAVLIFDGFENIDLGDPSAREHPSLSFLTFVKQLIHLLAHPDKSSVSEPFLLITHSGDMLDEMLTKALAAELGVPEKDLMYCPVDASDGFEDPIPLARKLIRSPATFEQCATEIKAMSHADPYKTWLLCYWANRSIRNDSPDDVRFVLDSRFARSFADITVLHGVIEQRLTESERLLLQAAAAWGVPWSVEEMIASLSRVPKNAELDVRAVVENLIHDRAPFLSILDHQVELDQFKPLMPQWDRNIRQYRFEMPSIAAKFFKTRLELDPHRHTSIYQGIARTMQERLEELKQKREKRGNEFEDKALTASLMTEIILSLCKASRATEAASLFTDADFYRTLRQLNSWDRTLQLGKAILESNSSDFPLDLQCHTAVVVANALAEAFRLPDAEDICDRFIKSADTDEYWRCRLRLIKARALRYSNNYRDALNEYALITKDLKEISTRPNPDTAVWLGRTLTATVQCLMSMGQLDEADKTLATVEDVAQEIADAKERRKIDGLRRRHLGTICLLRGDLDKAAVAFDELLREQAGPIANERVQRVQSIILYKQARVHVERARTWIPSFLCSTTQDHSYGQSRVRAHNDAHTLEQIYEWLGMAGKLLNSARQTLGRLDQGDRKWFPAIDLCLADTQLLQSRLRIAGTAQSNSPEALDHIERTVKLVKARLPNCEPRAVEGRVLEIELLLDCINWQRQIDDGTTCSAKGFVAEIQREFEASSQKPEHQLWDIEETNPYKQSRRDYERLFYLWRTNESLCVSRIDERNSISAAAARVYRRGTSRLYRHGMIQTAQGFHHLVSACFATCSTGLQELLEAKTCLSEKNRDEVFEILNQIAIQSLMHPSEREDPFFTIPTKVVCRLLGDHQMYYEVVRTGQQPNKPLQIQAGRSSLLRGSARKLAIWSAMWVDEAKWDELGRHANLSAAIAEEYVSEAQRRATSLYTYVFNFAENG